MSKEIVRTENAPAPFQGAPYNQAVKAGGLVFVAGQLGLKPGEKEIAGDITAQTEQVVEHRDPGADVGQSGTRDDARAHGARVTHSRVFPTGLSHDEQG